MSEPYVGPMLRHVPEHRGADGLGYGRCQECGEMWPCTVARRPAVIPPDPERDKRVAARRAADAARYGRALDRLFDQRAMHDYASGWQDGYAASEAHHNGHYGVTDESAVHVPHLHAAGGESCSIVAHHSLESRPCVYCGGQPCRVEFGARS